MGALLTRLVDQWLGQWPGQWLGRADADPIDVRDEASVALVRAEVRRVGGEVGLDQLSIESAASAASELAHNQLAHARGGSVAVRAVVRAGVAGVEIIAADDGPGIADPTEALRDGRPRPVESGGGLGVGLCAAHRLVDEMDADVRRGEGTCIWLRKFVAPVARSEIAIMGRPCAGETVSGDQASFVRGANTLLIGIADGLGHGEPARAASDLAIETVHRHAGQDLVAILGHCDTALADTRGAVMAVARLDLTGGGIEHASAGNIATRIYQRNGSLQALAGSARILGSGQPRGRVAVERLPAAPYQTVIMYSDGISSRFVLTEAAEILRRPALAIAHHVLREFGRDDDDALVLVAR